MKLFLAGSGRKHYLEEDLLKSRYILESFFYFDDWQTELLTSSRSFLLDSGAFTFMNSKNKKDVDWNTYADKYIDFIISNNIEHFFELDIDAIVGYEKVKQIRQKIEAKTGKQSIPVWHRSRGPQEYINLCKQYSYIAIGGFAIKDISRKEYGYIHKLLDKANSYGTKVHGLGFTPPDVEKYAFYSVDSSSWTSGSRFASVYLFSNGKISCIQKNPNRRLIDYKSLDKHNLNQWLKYQKYLDKE